jgi:hypothetical protein
MKRYPAIEFIARHGRRVAIGCGCLTGLLFMVLGWQQESASLTIIGIVAGTFAWGVARVGVEVVEVVAETLLPR